MIRQALAPGANMKGMVRMVWWCEFMVSKPVLKLDSAPDYSAYN
jgi:hypothetical protein